MRGVNYDGGSAPFFGRCGAAAFKLVLRPLFGKGDQKGDHRIGSAGVRIPL